METLKVNIAILMINIRPIEPLVGLIVIVDTQVITLFQVGMLV